MTVPIPTATSVVAISSVRRENRLDHGSHGTMAIPIPDRMRNQYGLPSMNRFVLNIQSNPIAGPSLFTFSRDSTLQVLLNFPTLYKTNLAPPPDDSIKYG